MVAAESQRSVARALIRTGQFPAEILFRAWPRGRLRGVHRRWLWG